MPAEQAALLALTDDIIGTPGRLSEQNVEVLQRNFSDAELAEVALGVGLFLGMSKVLITLGLEPEEMDTTLIPTPPVID